MIILSLLLLLVALGSAVFGLWQNNGVAVWYAEALFVVSLAFFLLAQPFIHKHRRREAEEEEPGARH